MGEAVRRTDPRGRSFRQILEKTIIKPLGMENTSVRLRADLRSRHIKPHWLFDKGPLQHLGRSNYSTDGAFEEEDAEMLRRGGEYNGNWILSPVTVERTRIDETPGMINQLYGRNAIRTGMGADTRLSQHRLFAAPRSHMPPPVRHLHIAADLRPAWPGQYALSDLAITSDLAVLPDRFHRRRPSHADAEPQLGFFSGIF